MAFSCARHCAARREVVVHKAVHGAGCGCLLDLLEVEAHAGVDVQDAAAALALGDDVEATHRVLARHSS